MKTIYLNYNEYSEKVDFDNNSCWDENISFNSVEFQYNYEKINVLYPSQLIFELKRDIQFQTFESSTHFEFLVIKLYGKLLNDEVYKFRSFRQSFDTLKGEYTTMLEYLGHNCVRYYSIEKFETICFNSFLNENIDTFYHIKEQNKKFLFEACFGYFIDNGNESPLFLKEIPWLGPYHLNTFFRTSRSRKFINPTKLKKCIIELNEILLNNKSKFLLNILERVYKYA